jgi:hypothetical protein
MLPWLEPGLANCHKTAVLAPYRKGMQIDVVIIVHACSSLMSIDGKSMDSTFFSIKIITFIDEDQSGEILI